MRMTVAATAAIVMCIVCVSAQDTNPPPPQGPESAKLALTYDALKATVITSADIAAAVAKFPATAASANGTFVERSDTAARLAYRVAVDRRRSPQSANLHPTEAEVLMIVDGEGTLTTGGKLIDTRRNGKTVSATIEGGASQRVTKGDVVVIPEGVPHYFTETSPQVVFVSVELPRPRVAQLPVVVVEQGEAR
jgi:mannose-6-phosphate isomerase-like protein (cupin superfamily)